MARSRVTDRIDGDRFVLRLGDPGFPEALQVISRPPQALYGIGDPRALKEGLAVVGARKATPYGISCAEHFAGSAARRGVAIISGGARGCDSASHRAALDEGGTTVAFLGGGCDEIYPKQNTPLFQEMVDKGGAIVSEHPFDFKPLPYTFRERNRLIAGLAKATLIVEAGLGSGTFSTADEAIAANREVLVIPGAITSKQSLGANRLIYQGATPIVDDETFADQLFAIFGLLRQDQFRMDKGSKSEEHTITSDESISSKLLEAVQAQAMGLEEILEFVDGHLHDIEGSRSFMMKWIAQAQTSELIQRQPDGRFRAKMKP